MKTLIHDIEDRIFELDKEKLSLELRIEHIRGQVFALSQLQIVLEDAK